MLESDEGSDWGSDFDDVDEEKQIGGGGGELYEIPDGKPSIPVPTSIQLPEWLRKAQDVENFQLHSSIANSISSNSSLSSNSNASTPQPQVYIEHVLLPTRATKDEESKNFIETLKRKLSQNIQKNLLVGKIDPKINEPQNTNISSNNHHNQNNHHQNHHLNNLTNNSNSPENGLKMKKIKDSLEKYPWFYRVDRNKAELILENYHTNGSFLVRDCYHGGPNIPFTLTIRYSDRLFHIQIRIRADNRFALGTFKTNEMHFHTVQEMVDTYKKTPLQLHSNGKFFGQTNLTQPPIVYSFSK